MNPAMAGYVSCQNGGRHGSVKLVYAVGRRCTKAVAMSTPVPKWREIKSAWLGIGSVGKRRTMMGNEHAAVERMRMRNKAKTWRGVL
jgi:hypothetical protein